jgi:hypothetical protein
VEAIPGVEQIGLDDRGVVQVTLAGTRWLALFDYPVTPAPGEAAGIAPGPDLNGDGEPEFSITYSSGVRQNFYLRPAP